MPTNLKRLQELKDYIIARQLNYAALIRCIQDRYPKEWEQIETEINSKYAESIFILKTGEFEDYLGLNGKGLDKVIAFCQEQVGAWYVDSQFAAQRSEIENIFQIIFDQRERSEQSTLLKSS